LDRKLHSVLRFLIYIFATNVVLVVLFVHI
jgi:hypothetical protein